MQANVSSIINNYTFYNNSAKIIVKMLSFKADLWYKWLYMCIFKEMRKIMKKGLVYILAAALAASVLVGCGKEDINNGTASMENTEK